VKGYADNENMWDHLGQLMPNSHYSPKKWYIISCSLFKLINRDFPWDKEFS
jgi:hypothetical protein